MPVPAVAVAAVMPAMPMMATMSVMPTVMAAVPAMSVVAAVVVASDGHGRKKSHSREREDELDFAHGADSPIQPAPNAEASRARR